jgi:predicted dehydrogenase
MRIIEPMSIFSVGQSQVTRHKAFFTYLSGMQHVRVSTAKKGDQVPADAQVVFTCGPDGLDDLARGLTAFVEAGGVWLHFVDGSAKPIPALFGVQPDAVKPATELRILFTAGDHPMAERLADAYYVPGPFQELGSAARDVETVLYTDWHYTHRAVLTRRGIGRGQVACTTLQALDGRPMQQIFYRLLLCLCGQPFGQRLGVGILGYAPSVGRLHGLGCQHTTGLELIAACDLNKEQREQARNDFAGIRCYDSGDDLVADPDVDLIIVATPPNTHAEICLRIMAAGKDVVCEKPLAIDRTETEALVSAQERFGVHLSCHQNRRFDADYLAVRRVIEDGLIGTPFYIETFVGGFSHPCGYWHSHAPVSGGTAYDWGAHYLDWIVSLFPEPIEAVIGTRHKKVWHDVSNADQERIQIRFRGGGEAEFIHSDVAAVRKPKWYLLGTQGALIGHWQDVSAYAHEPDHYFDRYDIPATEMPPDIRIFRRQATGDIVEMRPAISPAERFAFHRNLADHLLTGEPLAAPLSDSVKVVAILEAAARSMDNGGSLEVVDA